MGPVLTAQPLKRRMRARYRCYAVALMVCTLPFLFQIDRAVAEELAVRVAWGSGVERDSRQWQAIIRLDKGRIVSARGLGLATDAPGSLDVSPQRITVSSAAPRRYDGVDLQLDAPLTSSLSVELQARDDRGALSAPITKAPLAILASEKGVDADLDDKGNRLLIRRAPGDKLRFAMSRQVMVFAPGESIAFQVQPHLIEQARNTVLS